MANAELWQRAASFAARAHAGSRRKDGRTPYVAHPFRVAMTVRDLFGCDDSVAIAAALLHDTIEDTGTDFDDLAEAFGEEVAACVGALSKDASLPEAERERRYDERLASADWRARLVKLADVYDNRTDVFDTGDPRAVQRIDERCRRAIRLAEADRGRPCVDRAIAIVRALLEG